MYYRVKHSCSGQDVPYLTAVRICDLDLALTGIFSQSLGLTQPLAISQQPLPADATSVTHFLL